MVGLIGDGINDASALHAADVGISVKNAVDVLAKEVADLILLDKHLDVVVDGIIEGRKTYANTIKYIFITTSANFGNVITISAASPILTHFTNVSRPIITNRIVNGFSEYEHRFG